MNIGEVPRNDVEAALAYARAFVEEHGPLPPDEAEMLYMLQDDPKELARRLREGHVQVAAGAGTLRYP